MSLSLKTEQYCKFQCLSRQLKSSQRFKLGGCGSSKHKWKQSPSIQTNLDPSWSLKSGTQDLAEQHTLLQQHQELSKTLQMQTVVMQGKYSA